MFIRLINGGMTLEVFFNYGGLEMRGAFPIPLERGVALCLNTEDGMFGKDVPFNEMEDGYKYLFRHVESDRSYILYQTRNGITDRKVFSTLDLAQGMEI